MLGPDSTGLLLLRPNSAGFLVPGPIVCGQAFGPVSFVLFGLKSLSLVLFVLKIFPPGIRPYRIIFGYIGSYCGT